MRRSLPHSCFLLLLVSTSACEIAGEDDLDAEIGPDAGLDEEDEPDVGTATSAVTTPKLHLYGDSHYQGVHLTRNSYDANFGNDGFNDTASSLINPTGDFWLLYEHRDYGGRRICMRPSSRIVDLRYVAYGSTSYSWNDRISSVKRRGRDRSTCGDGVPAVGTRFDPSPSI